MKYGGYASVRRGAGVSEVCEQRQTAVVAATIAP